MIAPSRSGLASRGPIEVRDRVFVAPTAEIAMYDVRPGDAVDARYVQTGNGEKSMLSMVPFVREIQAP
jgi:hypothetical protein